MNLLTAIKKLGNKLTGKTYKQDELVSLMNQIADDYEGSGGGGGGGLALIPYTLNDNVITLGMTAQEILNGMLTGTIYAVNFDGREVGFGKYLSIIINVDDRIAEGFEIAFSTQGDVYSTDSYNGYPSFALY